MPRGAPPCDECTDSSRCVELIISDPSRPGRWGEIIFVQFNENGEDKMRLELYNNSRRALNDDPNVPDKLTMPEGTYTFVKQ